jgi:hypothetical protein
MPDRWLSIFVKAPRSGAVKTRLAAALGDDGACAAYRVMVATLLTGLKELAPVELRFTPDEALEEIVPWLRPGWSARPQGAGDLGARLAACFDAAFAAGARRVVVIGSDCPTVTPADIEAAWAALNEFDVVLGPAVDGGYWLVGLNAPRAELFQDVPWSTERVLAATLKRAASAGLRVRQLRPLSDIDTLEDWQAFRVKGGFNG